MPTVSVLVPIYNVEKYLAECLDSLANQTFRDFEVICINDGSTDLSRSIIQCYLNQDERFRVIDKPNSGYGCSMNQGLEAATGEYIAILESDDIFEIDALEKLVGAACRNNAQVVKADFWLYWSKPARREVFGLVDPAWCGHVVDPAQESGIFYQKPSIWSALYRKDFLDQNQIRFLETPGASYQDAGFNFKVWASADRVIFLTDCILNYRQDNEQSSVNSPSKVFCVCDEYQTMGEYLAKDARRQTKFQGILERMKFDSYLWNYDRLNDELKDRFIDRASAELRCDRDQGLVDFSLFEPWAEADFNAMVNHPETFRALRAQHMKGGKVATFKHYFRLGGLPLIAKVAAFKQRGGTAVARVASGSGQVEYLDAAVGVRPVAVPLPENAPRISVVVPIYNVKDTLEWCLASLRKQTLAEIEIICVNDGSTDGSRVILDRCKDLDPRIVIVDKENGGLSSARNAGIKAASTNLVCFLDSDDRFVPTACETLVNQFERTAADVITFGATCYPADAGYPWLEEHLSPRDAVYAPFAPELLFEEMSRPFAWRTACRKSFLIDSDVLFNEQVRFGEDQVFHFAVYPRAAKTVLLSDKLYEYRVAREGSLMDRLAKDPFTKLLEHVKIAHVIFDDWTKLDILDTYETEIASWTVEFILYDALMLPANQRSQIVGSTIRLLLDHYSSETLRASGCPYATQAIVDAAISGTTVNDIACKVLAVRYHAQQYGYKATLNRVLGR